MDFFFIIKHVSNIREAQYIGTILVIDIGLSMLIFSFFTFRLTSNVIFISFQNTVL